MNTSSLPLSKLPIERDTLGKAETQNPGKFGSEGLVVNPSDMELTQGHISLLRRGLTFCPTPGEPSVADLRHDLDKFHRNLKLKSHFGKGCEKDKAWANKLNKSASDSSLSQTKGPILGPSLHWASAH